MWWKPEPGSMHQAEAGATWQLVVELRTAVAQIGLESLAAIAAEVEPWVAQRWPTFGGEIRDIIEGLKEDPESPQHLTKMAALADELEDHLGTGLLWPPRKSMPNN